jgi:hypothetical protein
MSLARLSRDQGKLQQARELLAANVLQGVVRILRVAAAGQPDDLGMPILEPVSGQVGLRVLGKVISGCRDRTAITSVEAECENPETKSTGREGANTWVFGAAPGNLRRAATDWWSN